MISGNSFSNSFHRSGPVRPKDGSPSAQSCLNCGTIRIAQSSDRSEGPFHMSVAQQTCEATVHPTRCRPMTMPNQSPVTLLCGRRDVIVSRQHASQSLSQLMRGRHCCNSFTPITSPLSHLYTTSKLTDSARGNRG